MNAKTFVNQVSANYNNDPKTVRGQIQKAINSPYTYLSFTNNDIVAIWKAYNDKFYSV